MVGTSRSEEVKDVICAWHLGTAFQCILDKVAIVCSSFSVCTDRLIFLMGSISSFQFDPEGENKPCIIKLWIFNMNKAIGFFPTTNCQTVLVEGVLA